ncbi:MAG: hypothetical protein IPH96_12860 [Saprospiraceae bacterium]|nr:hypothetical protein [Saprospiraceae bacterium]
MDRIVEKRVEVPVDRIVEKRIEVPVDRIVEKIVEKRVEVPVDRIVEVIKEVQVPAIPKVKKKVAALAIVAEGQTTKKKVQKKKTEVKTETKKLAVKKQAPKKKLKVETKPVRKPAVKKVVEVKAPEVKAPKLSASEEAALARVMAKASKFDYSRIGSATWGQRDNLQLVVGIGPFIERKMHALNIYTFNQVAKFINKDVEQVTDAIEFFPGRIERDEWIRQCKEFVALKNKGKLDQEWEKRPDWKKKK